MEENVKKRFNKNILVISLVLVVALAVVLFILFNHVNPRKYYETGLNNLKTSLTTNVNKSKGNYTGVLDLSMDTNSKDSVKKILGDIDLNLVYGYDYNNKSLVFNVKSNYQNDKLVNGNIYLANNKVYFRADDLLDSYYYANTSKIDELFDSSKEDNLLNVINGINDAINANLKDNYFSSHKDGNFVIVTFAVTSDDNFFNNVLTTLKGNDTFVNSLAKLIDKDADDVKSYLNEDDSNKFDMIVDTYLKNKTFTKSIVKLDDGSDTININIEEQDDKSINYNVTSTQTALNVSGNVNVTDNNDSYKCKLVVNYDDVTYNISNEINYQGSISAPDVSGAQNFDDISYDDTLKLYESIYSNQALLKLAQAINNIKSDINNY